MRYEDSANGHQVDAKVKEELEISLSEARTAGYRWVAKSLGDPVFQLLEETAQPNPVGVGGSGHHLWQFRAVAAGTGEFEFHYLRSWEDPEKPARTFILKVRVQA